MFQGRSVAVIIPAFNEESHVGNVLTSVPAFVDRIFAIDDASTDDTWHAIRTTAGRMNGETANGRVPRRVVPIRHEENRGAGGAVVTGYRQALAEGIDVVAVMDGDGQMDPADLVHIVQPVATGDVDYAKGNRLHRPSDRASMSRWRLFGNVLLTMLTRVASGYWDLSDPQNGYTAISKEALADLSLDRLYPSYGFLNDVLIQLNRNGARVADVSHRGVYGDETSGIRYRRFVPGLSALLARRWVSRIGRTYVVDRFHPISVCYVSGIIVGSIGLIATIASAFRYDRPSLGTVLHGATTAGVGLCLLALGGIADVNENRGRVTRIVPQAETGDPVDWGTDRSVELASDGGPADDEAR